MEKSYIAIDLKSFYASCEARFRNLDPLNVNLVVADTSRTEKTICLAVSPTLKAYGIGGRARLFEVLEKVKEINIERLKYAKNHKFIGKSFYDDELKANPNLALDFIAATPQMAYYIDVSTKIYQIYLKYISQEDIHVYSIDEVFIDATPYLNAYKMNAHELARKIISDILAETGITATAGIGTNLYLAKVAMDIVAKHIPADKDGVRIASLNVKEYREKLWSHTPLTDFWRVGHGISNRLKNYNIYTMGDLALKAVNNPDLLYKEFGVNAELLIDHAFGIEPVEIKDIKAYKPLSTSLSTGQVLSCGYDFKKGLLIVKEMTDNLSLDLVNKNLVTNQLVLSIGYDRDILKEGYDGELSEDYLGRIVPKGSHGSINLDDYYSSSKVLVGAITKLYKQIVNPSLLVRRINIGCHTEYNYNIKKSNIIQLDIFTSAEELDRKNEEKKKKLENENNLQKAINSIHSKYGKNSLVKGMNLEEGATMMERNNQIGGHRK